MKISEIVEMDLIREDNAEIEKINAKLNEMQLAKVRDTFGLTQKDFFDLITKHPEKLLELLLRVIPIAPMRLMPMPKLSDRLLSLTRSIIPIQIKT